jgi:hypothetical protein
MKLSEIKLEAFNDCPGADEGKAYIATHQLHPAIRVVDLDNIFYTNSSDTLVLEIIKGPDEMKVALALGQMAVECLADEFTWNVIEGTYIVRLWWD